MTPTMSKRIPFFSNLKKLYNILTFVAGQLLKPSCCSTWIFIQAILPARSVLIAPKSIEHLKINKSVFELPPLDLINIILNWAGILHSDIRFVYIELQRMPKIDDCKPSESNCLHSCRVHWNKTEYAQSNRRKTLPI